MNTLIIQPYLIILAFFIIMDMVLNKILKAFFYYDKAIKNGSTFSYSNMGLLYEEGDGVEVDLSKALSLHKKGLDLKNYFSTYNLGRFYFWNWN